MHSLVLLLGSGGGELPLRETLLRTWRFPPLRMHSVCLSTSQSVLPLTSQSVLTLTSNRSLRQHPNDTAIGNGIAAFRTCAIGLPLVAQSVTGTGGILRATSTTTTERLRCWQHSHISTGRCFQETSGGPLPVSILESLL
jgi:hypothetical protein